MGETTNSKRDPFDLFGSEPAQELDIEPGADLYDLMRQGGDSPPIGRIDDIGPPPAPTIEDPLHEAIGAEPVPDPPSSGSAAPPVETVRPAPEPAAAEPIAEPSIVATPASAAVRPLEPIESKKLWFLRILLISNLAMMGLMLLLPHPLEPRQEYESLGGAADPAAASRPRESGVGRVDPLAPPARLQGLALPDDALYEKALLLALDGDFDAASAQLQQMLDANPAMNPAVAHLVHAQLGYYLRKAGRLPEAMHYESLVRQQAGRAQLPEELLQQARAAELRGDGAAMRRLYAEFLLQEGQLSPELRALVPEALLKLADSYRVMADGEGKER